MITDLKIKEAGTDTQVNALGLKDGAIVSADWVQTNLMLGTVYMCYLGDESTAGTFDAAYANTDPDIMIDVPDGTTIIPLKIQMQVEDYGSKALFETMALVSKTLGAATSTAFTPINVRTRAAGGSNCTCCTAPTVTSGYTAGSFELFHYVLHEVLDVGSADDDAAAQVVRRDWGWSIAKDGFAPVIDGEGSLQFWAISQACKGFCQIYWLEFATADLVS